MGWVVAAGCCHESERMKRMIAAVDAVDAEEEETVLMMIPSTIWRTPIAAQRMAEVSLAVQPFGKTEKPMIGSELMHYWKQREGYQQNEEAKPKERRSCSAVELGRKEVSKCSFVEV